MPSRREKCPGCDRIVFDGSWTKHNERHHQGRPHIRRQRGAPRPNASHPATPIHLLPTVPDVFRACGIAEADTPWSWELFDGLPNGRVSLPRSFEDFTIFVDPTLSQMPNVNELAAYYGYRLGQIANDLDSAVTNAGEYYIAQDLQSPTANQLLRWTTGLISPTLETTSLKALNIPGHLCLRPFDEERFQVRHTELVREYHGDDEATSLPLDGNITPRLSHTGIHHDALPHFSTATGLLGEEDVPAKLYILFPTEELARLGGRYGDTTYALQHSRGACFFVQNKRETTRIGDWPHSAIALSTSSLFGATYRAAGASWKISSVAADVGGGDQIPQAQKEYIDRITLCSQYPDRRLTNARRFQEFWSRDAITFPLGSPARTALIRAWSACIEASPGCPLCEAIELDATEYLTLVDSVEDHVVDHLANSLTRSNNGASRGRSSRSPGNRGGRRRVRRGRNILDDSDIDVDGH